MENIEKIEQLLNEVNTIAKSYERVAEATGENFNIFSILRMESDEVATHSRFIAELLNPKGRHGQKDLFLIKFINYFNNRFNKDENNKHQKLELETSTVEIKIEVGIGTVKEDKGGRLDILIKDKKQNIIMIENKIYAYEQADQLLRYSNYGKEGNFKNSSLIYLTLEGDDSNDPSSKEVDYLRYSYKDDIINWLEDCKKESASIPILRESITQYINLIKKLTNQNLNKKMNQSIINKIVKGGHLESYKILYDLKDDLVKSTISEIVLRIKESLKNDFNIIKFQTENIKNGKGRLFSFQDDILKEHQLSVIFEFKDNHNELRIGFIQESEKKLNDLKELSVFEEYKTWWLTDLGVICKDYDKFYSVLKEEIDKKLRLLN